MIAITGGNPTDEEVAAVVAALALLRGGASPAPAAVDIAWRRSVPSAESQARGLRRERCWQGRKPGWSSAVVEATRTAVVAL